MITVTFNETINAVSSYTSDVALYSPNCKVRCTDAHFDPAEIMKNSTSWTIRMWVMIASEHASYDGLDVLGTNWNGSTALKIEWFPSTGKFKVTISGYDYSGPTRYTDTKEIEYGQYLQPFQWSGIEFEWVSNQVNKKTGSLSFLGYNQTTGEWDESASHEMDAPGCADPYGHFTNTFDSNDYYLIGSTTPWYFSSVTLNSEYLDFYERSGTTIHGTYDHVASSGSNTAYWISSTRSSINIQKGAMTTTGAGPRGTNDNNLTEMSNATNWSYSFWIKPDAEEMFKDNGGTHIRYFMNLSFASGGVINFGTVEPNYGVAAREQKLFFKIYGVGGSGEAEIDWSVLQPGDYWYHFVLTFDGSGATNVDKLKFYINTVEQTLNFYSGNMPTAMQASASAGQWGSPSYGFPYCSILEYRLFNRTLGTADIDDLYNEGKGYDGTYTGSNLVQELLFKNDYINDDVDDNTTYDTSGNNHDMTRDGTATNNKLKWIVESLDYGSQDTTEVNGTPSAWGVVTPGSSDIKTYTITTNKDLTDVGFVINETFGNSSILQTILSWGDDENGVKIRQLYEGNNWGPWTAFNNENGKNRFNKIVLSRFSVSPVALQDGDFPANSTATFQILIDPPSDATSNNYSIKIGVVYTEDKF